MRGITTILLFFILFASNNSIIGQTEKDSLKQRLASYSKIDTNYILTLNYLAFTYKRTSTDTMLQLGMKTIELSDSLNYGAGLAIGYRCLCSYYADHSDIEKAISYGEKAIHIADSVNRPFLKAKALNNLANIYENISPEKALVYLLDALPLFHQVGDLNWEAIGYQTLGNLYREISNYEKSIEAHKKAIAFFEKVNPQNLVGQYINLGNTYKVKGEVQSDSAFAQKDFEQARVYYELALGEFENSGNAFGTAVTSTNLGTLLMLLKKYYLALAAHEKALKANLKVGHEGIEYLSRWGKIEILRILGQSEASKRQALDLLEEKKGIMNADNFSDLYGTLAKVSLDLEEYEEAYHYTLEKIKQEKEIDWNSQLKLKLTEISSEYESVLQESQLDLLAQKRRKNRIQQLGITGIIIVLLIVGIIWVIQTLKIREKQKRFQIAEEAKIQAKKSLNQERLQRIKAEKNQLKNIILLKNQSLINSALQLANKNLWLEKLNQELEETSSSKSLQQIIKTGLDQDKNWDEMGRMFEELHPDFLPNLKNAFPKLSKADLRLAALYRMNLSRDEMIQFLAISPDSLKMARYRLRKKMELENEEELIKKLNEEFL